MAGWLEVFIVVAAIAIVIQSVMLVAMFFQVKKSLEEISKITNELQNRMGPILLRVSRILDDSEERIHSIMSDASEITRVARSQAQKVDRVFTEALDRLREQILRADQIITGTLEIIEDTGSKFKNSVWRPVQQASAIIKGIKAGIDVLRRRQDNGNGEPMTQDEELFI
jgi:uncharacterized protein YoxC